jgi:hypothetical protein
MRRIIKNKSKGPSEMKETKGKGFFRLAAAPASGSRYQKQRAAKTKAMLVIKCALNMTSEKKNRTAIPKKCPTKYKKKPQKMEDSSSNSGPPKTVLFRANTY